MEEFDFKKGQRLFSVAKKKFYIVQRISRKEPKVIQVRLDEPGKAYYYNVPLWRARMIFVQAESLHPQPVAVRSLVEVQP